MAFKGKKAKSKSELFQIEKKVAKYLVPKVPEILDTKVLTMMTVLWGLLVVLFYFLGRTDIRYLFAVSGIILLQWLTDILDGGVGRYRNQGLVKWGFYMDHLLDYYFLCCVILGLYVYLQSGLYLLASMIILGMFFISTFLRFGALNRFSTSFMGLSPAELRLIVIGTNLVLYYFSKDLFYQLFRWFLILTAILLVYNIYKTQKEIYRVDMKEIKKT